MNYRLHVEGVYVNIRTKISLHTRAIVVVMLLASSVCATTRVAVQDSWDEPPFSVDAAKLYDTAAAQSVPEGTEAVVVLDEERVVFEADSRSRHTWHSVYRVLTPDGRRGLVSGGGGVGALAPGATPAPRSSVGSHVQRVCIMTGAVAAIADSRAIHEA